MKNKLHISVVVAAMCAASNNAWSQSSLTLYGLVDGGINFLSNAQTGKSQGALTGHSKVSIQDGTLGGLNASRFGILGTEDLGGGLSAIFKLESGFAINSGALGQGSDLFGRQARVGLRSNQFGTISLGRQYDPAIAFIRPFTIAAQLAGFMGTHVGDMDDLDDSHYFDSSITYTSLDYNGLVFGGMYGVGGVAGSPGRDQTWALGGGYTNGPIALGINYLNAQNPNFSYFGGNPASGTTATSNNLGSLGSATEAQANPIYAGYASAHTLQSIAAGGSYAVGRATLGVTYSNTQFRSLGDTGMSGPNPFGYGGNVTFSNAEVNFRYQITPVLLAGIAYDYTHSSGADGRPGAVYQQGAAGLNYALSKQTNLYAAVVFQHASGTDSLNQPAVADITGQTASANNHQLAVRIGLQARF